MLTKPTYEDLARKTEELEKEIARLSEEAASLQESKERYLLILDELDEGYFEVDLTGKFTFFNNWLPNIAGDDRDYLLKLNNRHYMTPESAKKAFKAFNELYRTGTPVKNFEHEIVTSAGEHMVHELSASLMKDREGAPIGFKGTVRDITGRKQAEKALQESEERFRLTFQTSPDSICISKYVDNRYIDVNQGFTEETGYLREDAIGNTSLDLNLWVDEKDREYLRRELRKKGFIRNMETKFRRKDGSITASLLSASEMMINNEMCILTITRDIGELKQAQEEREHLAAQLQQAQKMEAIGTLAGGIAHDFNNILMGIQGRISLLLLDTETAQRHSEHLKEIENYVKNAADLTNRLLGFAMGGKYEVKPTRISDLLEKSSNLFGRTRKEITIHSKYQENEWNVEVDQGQIEQVLLNLFVNAWQAMSGGGELFLETKNVVLDDAFTTPHHARSGKYVMISVSDTGMGMDKSTQERIFEPFFTTREMGRGTGLGMASAYGIIKGHDGIIIVSSEIGAGTTFTIYLPSSEKEVKKQTGFDDGFMFGTEGVLLVDDEIMITDVGERLLEKLGYVVYTANSGKEALEIFDDKRDQIDLVILDMIMPEMNGGEVFDRLKARDSEIKTILCTGYSVNGEATEILDRGCDGFIQKPFSLNDFSKKLREVLDKN